VPDSRAAWAAASGRTSPRRRAEDIGRPPPATGYASPLAGVRVAPVHLPVRRYAAAAVEAYTYQDHFDMEERHWWFRSRRQVLWALISRAGVGASPRILDAGCGTGRNLMEFSRLGPIEGVDLSPQAVEFCVRRGLTNVRRAALEDLPYEDERFDLVLATDVIEHLEDEGPALEELRRVTAQNGRLILTVPAYQWLWSNHDTAYHHFRRYTRRRLADRARAGGWEPVAGTYFYSSLLAPVATVRMLQRLRALPTPDEHGNGKSDLQLSPRRLNRMLELPVRAEAALIRRGASLPAGVSVGMACMRR
jgi:SAM-dependent methyltransferase